MNHRTPGQKAAQRFRKNRPAVAGTWFLAALVGVVLLWPVGLTVAGWCGPAGVAFAQDHAPNRLTDDSFQPPDARHWFGTDVHGRDVFSRVLYGAQVSLLVGVVGAGVSLVLGVLWGAVLLALGLAFLGAFINGWRRRSRFQIVAATMAMLMLYVYIVFV